MTATRRTALVRALLLALGALAGCGGAGARAGAGDAGTPDARAVQSHSAALVVNPAGTQLFVVHPDTDSVSILDLGTRRIAHEVLLAAAPPAADGDGRYTPAVAPRALALDSTGRTLYVTGTCPCTNRPGRARFRRFCTATAAHPGVLNAQAFEAARGGIHPLRRSGRRVGSIGERRGRVRAGALPRTERGRSCFEGDPPDPTAVA